MRPLASLPDAAGTALLHAALDRPDVAARAWDRVRHRIDVTEGAAPTEGHRLLPLVHRNLPPDATTAGERADLRRRYDQTWAANERRVALTARWVALLDLGGVPASVLKGIPLAVRDYADVGVRPMADIDLVVPFGMAGRALDLLEGAGWRDVGGCSREVLARLYHGSGMVHPDGGSLDVHWLVAGFLAGDFQPRLEEIVVGGRTMTTLDRTDTLLHVCLHGAWTGSSATTRWVADAVTVARAADADGEGIDAERLLEVADRHRVGAILGTALQHIAQEHDAPLPGGLADGLRAQTVSRRVRHRQRVVTAPLPSGERIEGLAHLRAYWAYTRWGWSDGHAARTLPAFLVELWGLDSPRQLPAALLTRPMRRLRR